MKTKTGGAGRKWTFPERQEMEKLIKLRYSNAAISLQLNRARQSISAEFLRAGVKRGDYNAIHAQEIADNRIVSMQIYNGTAGEKKLSQDKMDQFEKLTAEGTTIKDIVQITRSSKASYFRWLNQRQIKLSETEFSDIKTRLSALEMLVGTIAKTLKREQ